MGRKIYGIMGGKQRHAPSLTLERIARSRADEPILVVGIDEVGTGALAGPVITAAVAFEDDENLLPTAVRDSKVLEAEDRKKLFQPIIDAAISTIARSICWPVPVASR